MRMYRGLLVFSGILPGLALLLSVWMLRVFPPGLRGVWSSFLLPPLVRGRRLHAMGGEPLVPGMPLRMRSLFV